MKLAIMYSQKPNGTQAVRGTIEDIDGVIRCSSGMESIVQAMRQSCAIEKGYYHLAEHGLPIIDRWPSAAETLAHIRDHYDDYVPGRLRVLEA